MRLLVLLLWIPCSLWAQDCLKDYKTLMAEANRLIKQAKPDYKKALNIYSAARTSARDCNQNKDKEINEAINQLFVYIDKQHKRALEAERKLRIEKNKVRDAEAATTAARKDAVAEAERKERLIKALYFYEGKYALAYQNGRYGYINKDGHPVIPYKYNEATPFSAITGFAKVKRNRVSYLLSTDSSEYQLAEDLASLLSKNNKANALDYSNRRSGTFPFALFEKKSLAVLLYTRNKLTELPNKVQEFKELQILDLSHNSLTTLPQEIGVLTKLRSCRLNNNNIKTLPTTIGNAKALDDLELNNNKLTAIPSSIGQLTALEKLYLYKNKLKTLPKELSKLTKLKRLLLAENQFTTFPEAILGMKNLERLSLSQNQIEKIPSTISQLKKLQVLRLKGNPISNEHLEEIRQWLPNCKVIKD